MRSLVKIKSSQNGKITLSLTDIVKSYTSCEFLALKICYLTLFAKINSCENFRIYSISPAYNLTALFADGTCIPRNIERQKTEATHNR